MQALWVCALDYSPLLFQRSLAAPKCGLAFEPRQLDDGANPLCSARCREQDPPGLCDPPDCIACLDVAASMIGVHRTQESTEPALDLSF